MRVLKSIFALFLIFLSCIFMLSIVGVIYTIFSDFIVVVELPIAFLNVINEYLSIGVLSSLINAINDLTGLSLLIFQGLTFMFLVFLSYISLSAFLKSIMQFLTALIE